MSSEETTRLVEHILEVCQRNRQRITYGALADYVQLYPQTVMDERPRDHLHSWVVNNETELPTHYTEDEMHPELLKKKTIVRTRDDLIAFLELDKRSPVREPAVRARRSQR
jgi:hypothetical protein